MKQSMIDVSGHWRNQRRESGFSQSDQAVVVNSCGYQAFYTKSLWKKETQWACGLSDHIRI